MFLAPPTTGKIKIATSKGDIFVDLWCKEVPIAARLFMENCIKGKYNGRAFDIIKPEYLVQLSVSDKIEYNLKDEYHSRIRWHQRGMLGAIFNDKQNNHHLLESFFITLTPIPELANRAILLGKITNSDSWYNLLKISESELDNYDKPRFPVVINLIEVIDGFFNGLTIESKGKVDGPLHKKQRKDTALVIKKPKVKISYEESANDGSDDDDDEAGTTVRIQMKSANETFYGYLETNKQNKEAEIVGNTDGKVEELSIVGPAVHIEASDDTSHRKAESSLVKEVSQDNKDKLEAQDKVPEPEKILRDPTIDSDFDSDLEFDDVKVDLSALNSHHFTSRQVKMIQY
ncbi:Peptidyl-prolyl isomerase cwc27 [Scheffersomyces spartinae]|uniref:Peptidyl-prolyl isomerase cwc27 n=1 Tax=Scheffersomyces spartinae TaxID=45513 RepID=A0A9P7V909_9ASCO|nr:Peptidyl-prolyl isomerase cwc27 [Scheffersomyces spartinae]KAG7193429.1 Peptidyl-prolyl isomerase cwc27 [Scheffersomyces spartinae]